MVEIPKPYKKGKSLNVILGAGFSRLACLPLADEIKDKFDRTLLGELLYFSTDKWAWRNSSGLTERHNGSIFSDSFEYAFILEEIVNAYKTYQGYFLNYEDFYQYVVDHIECDGWYREIVKTAEDRYYSETLHKRNEGKICFAFKNPNKRKIDGIINHLIADLLELDKTDEELAALYKPFIDFITKYESVYIFSLNHDTLLERLFSIFGLEFCDGFSTTNSNLIKWQTECHLSTFQNEFSTEKIRLIKLHGSINTYAFRHGEEEGITTCLNDERTYYKVIQGDEKFQAVRINEKGEVIQTMNPELYPKFITGNRKSDTISKDLMYLKLYELFEQKMKTQDDLLICGYSYKDEHIENCLKEFTDDNSPKVININPREKFPHPKPKAIHYESINGADFIKNELRL